MSRWRVALQDGAARRPALIAAFGAGLLAAAGQAPLDLWPVSLMGFAGLIWLTLPADGPAKAARLTWFGGGGYFMAALSWIVEPFLVDIARHGWMAPFAIVLLGFGLSLFWAAAGYLAGRVSGRGRRALALVAALCAAELARSYVLTGFPWAVIGHVWIATPVLQLAALGGAISLTALVLLAAALPVAFGMRGALAAVAMIAASWGWGLSQQGRPDAPRETPITVRLIQPNAAQHLKWRTDKIPEFYQRQLALTAEPGAPDLIVWPETSVAYLLHTAGPVLREMGQVAGGPPIIFGVQRREGDRVYNAAAMIDAQGGVQQRYDKHHLVPFGEYMPFADLFARFGLFGLAAGQGYGYSAGPGAQVWDLGALGKVLPLICYEAVFPQDLRAAPTRPDWVLQITNDAWFGSFSGPYQHLAQARLRAVEQGLPVVRSANTGVSAVIDGHGRVTGALALNTAGQLTLPVPPALEPTLYARMGDGPIALLIVLALALTVWPARRFSD